MRRAIALSRCCPSADRAYSVGAVIVAGGDMPGAAPGGTITDGAVPGIDIELAHGYSRETDETVHAEESALAKLTPGDPRLGAATLYSTLEPCSLRASRPQSCTELILAAGIRRVVIAWREPALFVADGQGVELLTAAGVTVIELPELADAARAVNAHLKLG
jgi:pyrimidine deaminase RibD-like protein